MKGAFPGLPGASLARTAIWLLAMLVLSPLAHAWRLEAGQASTNNTFNDPTFRQITFQQAFDVPPIVVVLASDQGGDSSDLRIRAVTETGFEVAPPEPTGNDGAHVAMDFDYIAVEPGIHYLPDGTQIVAGRHDTSTVQRANLVGGPSGYDLVPFGATLSGAATVLATIQTTNSETAADLSVPSTPWLTVVMINPSDVDFEVALERSEVAGGTVQTETIGYVAIVSGSSGSFLDTGDVTTSYAASTTADNIVGNDNGCRTHVFSSASFAQPRVVASKLSRDGGDGGWLRQCSLSGTEIGLFVEEDIANDSERAHTTEIAGVVAFSRSFHAEFNGELQGAKTVSVEDAPALAGTDPLSIPGARVRYALNVSSIGNTVIDPGTIELIDSLPSDVRLLLSDIDGLGSGPVRFSPGAVPTGLTYTFSGLASTTDDVDFSTDGVDFSYVPVLAGDGTDGDITHIRIKPQGLFEPQSGTQIPSFTVEFDALVE